MTNWLALLLCQSRTQHEACSQKNLDHALEVQQHNAAAWIGVIRPEQQELNLKALKMIVSAPIFNEYYSENIKLYNQVLVRNGAINITLRSVSSIGFAAAASLPAFSPLIKYCRAAINKRADILQLCLDAGKRMSSSAQTILVRAIGDAIQKIVLEAYNDVDGLKRLEQEGAKSKYLNSPLWYKANSLLMYDLNLAEKWFDNLVNYGEVRASELLIEEAIFLSSDERYDPCNNRNNSVSN